MKKGGFVVATAGFLLFMQLFRITKINPPVIAANDFASQVKVPPEQLKVLRQACYDCHSNETRYPWYTDIAPFSWRVSDHIKDARTHLNFSEWGTYTDRKKAHRLSDIQDAFSNGWMPLWDYKLAHKEARLSPQQRTEMANWLQTLL